MFLRLAALFTVGLLGLAGAKGFAQDTGKMTAKDVIKKAIDASGGLETLKKFQGTTEKSKGTMDLSGAEVTFQAETSMMSPDKMKTNMKMEVLGQKVTAVQLINGDKIRMVANGMDVPVDDASKEEMKSGMILHKISTLYPLLDEKEFTLKLADDKKKVEDKEAYVLTVTGKSLKNEVKLFVDASSFLITKVERKGMNAAQQEGNQEMFFYDYKKVEGIMIPMKSKVLHEGKKFLESTTTEVKLFEKLPAADFEISD